jgi:hypothetical protein
LTYKTIPETYPEETDAADVYPKVEEWVGGCHAKAGLKLYNTDPTFESAGGHSRNQLFPDRPVRRE